MVIFKGDGRLDNFVFKAQGGAISKILKGILKVVGVKVRAGGTEESTNWGRNDSGRWSYFYPILWAIIPT